MQFVGKAGKLKIETKDEIKSDTPPRRKKCMPHIERSNRALVWHNQKNASGCHMEGAQIYIVMGYMCWPLAYTCVYRPAVSNDECTNG